MLWQNSQKGELALTLSIIGLVFAIIGVGIGTVAVKQQQSNSAQAQQAYVYKSVLEIRNEAGQVVDWKKGMMWSNTSVGTTAKGDIRDPNQSKARLTWQPTNDQFPPHLENTTSDVTVALPGYEIVGVFCTSSPQSLCDESSMSSGQYTRRNMRIKKGMEVAYGWIVRPIGQGGPTAAPTVEPTYPPQPTTIPSPTAGPTVAVTQAPTPTPTTAPTAVPTPLPTTVPSPTHLPTTAPTVPPSPTPDTGVNGFRTRLEIIDAETGSIIEWEPGMKYISSSQLGKFEGDVRTGAQAYIETYTPSVPPDLEGQTASVILVLPDTYYVDGAFCTSRRTGTVCEGAWIDPGLAMIDGVRVESGENIVYGFRVRKAPQTNACTFVGGNPNGKERIVFLPVGFEGYSQLQLQTSMSQLVTGIQKTNITQHAESIGYYLHSFVGEDGEYGCKKGLIGSNSDAVSYSCYPNLTSTIRTSECSGTSTVFVAGGDGWDVYPAYAWKDTNNTVINMAALTDLGMTAGIVFWHELGHSIIGLDDEYYRVENTHTEAELDRIDRGSINCSRVRSDGSCKWGSLDGCYAGCAYKANAYRPSEKSIMNSIRNTDEHGFFNKPSLQAWDKHFASGGQFSFLADADFAYKNSLAIQFTQQQPGELDVDFVRVIDSYPLPAKNTVLEEHVTVQLLATGGSILFETTVPLYNDNPHDDEEPRLRSAIPLFLPYSEEAASVIVRDENDTILKTITLSDYEIGNVTTYAAGSLCGNAVCDAGLGEDANSCRADCGDHLRKSLLERGDLDNNKFVNTLDLAILIDEDVYLKGDKGDIDGDGKTNAIDYTLELGMLGMSL